MKSIGDALDTNLCREQTPSQICVEEPAQTNQLGAIRVGSFRSKSFDKPKHLGTLPKTKRDHQLEVGGQHPERSLINTGFLLAGRPFKALCLKDRVPEHGLCRSLGLRGGRQGFSTRHPRQSHVAATLVHGTSACFIKVRRLKSLDLSRVTAGSHSPKQPLLKPSPQFMGVKWLHPGRDASTQRLEPR